MPKTASSAQEPLNKDKVVKQLGPLAGALKAPAKALWKVFVWRYIAKGAAEVVAAAFIFFGSVHLLGSHTYWLFVPGGLVTVLFYDAVMLLINPAYPAMNDAIDHVSELKGDAKKNVFTLLG